MLRSLKSVLSLAAVAIFATAFAVAAAPSTATKPAETYGRLPLLFERNEGQVDPAVQFLSRGRGYSLYLTASEGVLRLDAGVNRAPDHETATVRWQVVGANADACVSGERPQATKSNYFIGNDRSRWRTGVANYGQVRYEGVYPGIDLVYHGNQRQVEYDFVVAPKADPKRIRLAFDGIDSMHVGEAGELVLRTAHGDVVQPRPLVYQERNGKRQPVEGDYALLGDNQVSFRLGRYDRSRELVIDPVIVYSTYFGGTGFDEVDVIAADADGNAYVAGLTISTSFPGSDEIVIQPASGGDYDAYIAKINPQGTAVVWATYLGGTEGVEYSEGIAVDSSGYVYVSGDSNSRDFPVTAGALQTTHGGNNRDSWAVKINPTGTALVYCTYLGGSGDEGNLGITADNSGNAYVFGYTGSPNFPGVTGSSIQPSYAGGGSEAYLVKLNATGTAAVYGTYLGGTAGEDVSDVFIDGSGNAYVTGDTSSTTFPGVNGSSLQPASAGSSDVYVMKINAAGSAILWATFLGGPGLDTGQSIELDSSGNIVIGGLTFSTTFPGVTASSIQPSAGGTYDGYIVKLNTDASAILWATFIGGTAAEHLRSIGLDAADNVYAGGWTYSTTFPGVTASSFQPNNAGDADAFLMKINAAGTSILWATYLGASTWEAVHEMDVDAAGNVYAVGLAESTFPGVTSDAIQPVNAGGNEHGPGDGYIIKITELGPTLASINPTSGYPGTQVTLTGTNFGALQGSGSVWLGSKLAGSIVSWTNTQIVAVVAGGATSGSAFVQQNGIWSSPIAFTVIAPSITSISPASGYPGTQVTLTGTNFGATQGSGSVWLGNKAAGSIVSWSDTQVVATVAANAASGSAQVQQNGVWSNTIAFTVPTPGLTGVSPTTARAGDSITLNGTNFGATQGSGSVWLGNKLAGSIVSWSNTQIVAVVASGAKSGSAQVQQGGVWSNSIAFTVITPNVTSISPTSGPVGTQVTITGTGFGTTQGSGLVWIGTKYATVVSWSDTQVVATVAASSATGGTQVYQNGVWSNAVTFTVTP